MKPLFASVAAYLASAAIAAADLRVEDARVIAAMPNAPAAAAFLRVVNGTGRDDRLVGAASEIAERVELHRHEHGADGVMRMVAVEDGFAIPAGGTLSLERSGDHLMIFGLDGPLSADDEVSLTLYFEHAGEQDVTVPVQIGRAGEHAAD